MKVQFDESTGEYYLKLEDLKPYVDTELVVYSELEDNGDSLIIKFYDKDKNLLKTK
jgi:hypothetical protein